jgi:hypothetical protein
MSRTQQPITKTDLIQLEIRLKKYINFKQSSLDACEAMLTPQIDKCKYLREEINELEYAYNQIIRSLSFFSDYGISKK